MKSLLGAMALAAALLGMAGPATAALAERPLTGTVTGTANFVPVAGCEPVGLQTQVTGSGIVTHLGPVTMTAGHCTPAGADIAGRMILTAANGDQLQLDYTGTCDVPSPDWVPGVTQIGCDNPFTVAGGTGRFADASGTGRLTATVTFMGMGAPDWPGTWVIDARIRY